MKNTDKSSFWTVALFAFVGLFIGLILSATSSCTSATNCNRQETTQVKNQQQELPEYTDRFVRVEIDRRNSVDVVYDKHTRVMYAISAGYYNRGSLTMLCDSTGKPLLWRGNE